MIEEIMRLCTLLRNYRALALDEHTSHYDHRDPTSYFNKRMRELDQQAQDFSLPGIHPVIGDYNDGFTGFMDHRAEGE